MQNNPSKHCRQLFESICKKQIKLPFFQVIQMKKKVEKAGKVKMMPYLKIVSKPKRSFSIEIKNSEKQII